MLKKLLAVMGTLALAAGLVALVAAPANAHDHKVTADCKAVSVNLTYYQHQKNNTDTPNHVTVWIDSTTTTSTDQAFGTDFAQTYNFTQGAATHTYRVSVTAWDDTSNTDRTTYTFDTGFVTVTGCETSVVPADVTWNNAYCTGANQVGGGGYTIPSSTMVSYALADGTILTSGSHDLAVGTGPVIHAVAKAGYKLDKSYTWTPVITGPNPSSCILPSTPTATYQSCTTTAGVATSAFYTIPASSGYKYYLNGDTTKPALPVGPTYVTTFPSSVTIVAVADGSHTFPDKTNVTWKFDFVATPACLGDSVFVNPTVAQGVCTGPGVSGENTYTIPAATGAHFTIKINGGAELPVVSSTTAPTTYGLGSDAVDIVITAYPDAHYQIKGQTVFPFHLNATGDCLQSVTPKATSTDSVCDAKNPGSETPGTYTLTAVEGVTYHITVGTKTLPDQKSGTFNAPVGSTVTVTASADAGYKLSGSFLFSHQFVSQGDCTVKTAAGSVSFVNQLCDTDHPGKSFAGSFTVTQGGHVTYQVSISSVNGGAYAPLTTVGTAVPTTPGDVVTVKVIPDSGYKLDPAIVPADWTHTFPANNECLVNTTAVKPDFTSQDCVPAGSGGGLGQLGGASPTDVLTDAYIVIPNTTGVQYSINGTPTAYDPTKDGKVILDPGTYQVTAAAKTGYVLDASYPTGGWKVVLTSAEPCGQLITHPLVDPTASQTQLQCFAGGSFTLGNDLNDPNAIIWTVNGSVVSAGPYKVTGPGTYTIHAAANAPTYGLEDNATTSWVYTFTTPGTCDLKTLALTGSSPTGWIALGYLMLIAGLTLVAIRFVRRRGEQG